MKYSLDFGSVCFLFDGVSVVKFYSLLSVAEYMDHDSVVATERSTGSFDTADRDRFVLKCKEKNIEIRTINQNKTKNYRLDNNLEKTDDIDVRAIFDIAFKSNYATGIMTISEENVSKLFDSHISSVNKAIQKFRRNKTLKSTKKKYIQQHNWLTDNGFMSDKDIFPAAYYQWVIAAEYARNNNLSRNEFDMLVGLYGLGRRSTARASANRDALRSACGDKISNPQERKHHLRIMRRISRQIYSKMGTYFPTQAHEFP